MICVSIGNCSAEECIKALEGLEFAEIRMDTMDISEKDVETIFVQKVKLIATCRPPVPDEKRKRLLKKAIEFGASLVDIEVDSKEEFKKEIIEKAKERKCKVIISYHNHEKTPKKAELEHMINWCKEEGADIVKIACMVQSNQDNARLLGLLDSKVPLVIIGMGEKGKIVRKAAPLVGGLFTYASDSNGKELAPGQMTKEELEKLTKVLWDE